MSTLPLRFTRKQNYPDTKVFGFIPIKVFQWRIPLMLRLCFQCVCPRSLSTRSLSTRSLVFQNSMQSSMQPVSHTALNRVDLRSVTQTSHSKVRNAFALHVTKSVSCNITNMVLILPGLAPRAGERGGGNVKSNFIVSKTIFIDEGGSLRFLEKWKNSNFKSEFKFQKWAKWVLVKNPYFNTCNKRSNILIFPSVPFPPLPFPSHWCCWA